jgi:predicted DsbA family dithiol-disulfide isomerase
LAAEDGLTLKFSKKLPNTRLALFIAEFAKKEGNSKFDQYHKLVMEKYWKEGVDVGDLSVLLDICASIGLDREKVQEYIQSDEPLNILRDTSNELGAIGINGVPSFKIGGKFIVGAQPLDVFRRVIRSVIEKS